VRPQAERKARRKPSLLLWSCEAAVLPLQAAWLVADLEGGAVRADREGALATETAARQARGGGWLGPDG
jgi:hypothetical protein